MPDNDAMTQFHRQLPRALRKVFLPDSKGVGALSQRERDQLAIQLGLQPDAGAKKAWTTERVVAELHAIAVALERPTLMPKQRELAEHSTHGLLRAIKKLGGQSKVAAMAGLIYQGQAIGGDGTRTYWTEERIGRLLRDVAEKEGHAGEMPTQAECRRHAPNPNTIITILTQGGWYGKRRSWFEIANHFGLLYKTDRHRLNLEYVRAFVENLGEALYSLTSAEIYVLFEQQGINRTGKFQSRERPFDNLVSAIQSGYLPREELQRWTRGEPST